MKTETVQLDALTADPANVRAHPTRNVDAIKASLKRFGQQKPVVVDGDDVVVAGNGLVEAARSLGWSEVSVVRTSLTGSDRTAYAIADNRTAELAEWCEAELAETLAALAAESDLDGWATGFGQDELEALLADVQGVLPADADGREIDESCADDVKTVECPHCGKSFPI